MKLTQLKGMIYYETLMLWRQRFLPGAMLLLLLFMQMLLEPGQVGTLFSPVDVEQFDSVTESYGLVPDLVRPFFITDYIMASTATGLMLVMALVIPFLMSQLIPLDRHYGVRELLDSLPLGRSIYLTGKLLGAYVGLLMGLASIMTLHGLVTWLRWGAYYLEGYLLMLAAQLPLVLFVSGLAVMLAAGQKNRRQAMMVAGVFTLYLLTNLLLGGRDSPIELNTPFSLDKYDQLSSYYFVRVAPEFFESLSFDPQQAQKMLDPVWALLYLKNILGLLQIILAWLITWGWMRWREGR